MTTNTATSKGHWEYRIACQSLVDAEELRDMLAANPLPGNDYYVDAMANAHQLVDEMDRNIEDVMDRFTPAQCGL